MQPRLVRNNYGPSCYVWLWDMYSAEPRLVLNGALYNKGDQFMYLFDVDADRNVSVAWRLREMLANGPSNGFKEGRRIFSEGQEIDVSPSWIDAASVGPEGVTDATLASSFPLALPRMEAAAFTQQSGAWTPIAPEVSVFAAGNHTYSMVYFNGTFTYTEPFTFIRIGPAIVNGVGQTISNAVAAAAGTVTAQPTVAAACKILLETGGHWMSKAVLEPDGSLVIMLAAHFCGTRAFGIDLTATPIPGVPANIWSGLVNGIRALGG